MAVDANIIIYDGIPRSCASASRCEPPSTRGFARAFWTVFDAHVTNFVAGVVLYSYGSGPIRGFAVTLLVGIVTNCSPPTAVALDVRRCGGPGGAARATCLSEDAMPATNPQQKFFEIIKRLELRVHRRQKYWIGLSIVLVTLTIIMLPLNAYVFKSRGHMLNWGVDFRGGSEILLEFSKPVEAGEIRKTVADAGFPDPTWSSTPTRRGSRSGTT